MNWEKLLLIGRDRDSFKALVGRKMRERRRETEHAAALMKKIITTVVLALAATSAAHGVIGDNPLQLAARFKTKPIVVEQMTPRTIRVVYVQDGWIIDATLLDGISKAELMARADNGLVGYEDASSHKHGFARARETLRSA